MAGIVSYGAYVPIYRLGREIIAREWGTGVGRGEKAVANYDEDSITMAVEAVLDCLGGMDRHQVDGLYFASTTSPYREKESASIVAAASDLRRDIFTADFADSLRAGSSALRAGLDAIKSGTAKRVLVVAADCRLPAPNSDLEPLLGDGAAALLLGDSETLATVEDSYSLSSEFMGYWRTDQDRYPQGWEDRFVHEGYGREAREAASELLKRRNLSPKDFSKAIIYAHDARRHREVARALGFDLQTQLQDGLFDLLGNTGAAFAFMMLVAALEEARPRDRLLLVSYGDGCDAYLLQATEQAGRTNDRRGIRRHLESKMMLPSYGKYLRFRDLLEWEVDRRPPDRSSLTQLHRDRRQVMVLAGQKCKSCGGIQYPVMSRGRICTWCQAKDNFEEIRLSDKKGTLFTFSMDERAMEPDLPNVLCIVDFEGGGRFFSQMTDRDPDKLEVGIAVEPTFRKIHSGSGLYNYYWKVRPVRC